MELRDKVIYQAFPRNHTKEGTLRALEKDLERIAGLGIDILYLLPLQPIGRKARKGSLGSPYAVRDYRAINPELGDWDDFRSLASKAHSLGMLVMVDQVFNHTARDSVLIEEHPEWYWRDKDGNFGNKAGDWADVYDLDHTAPGLDDYLVDVLLEFVEAGADGFRFDVASFIPASFYRLFRKKAAERFPGKDIVLLAENVEPSFTLYARSLGHPVPSNGELADAGIDLFYSYTSFRSLVRYLDEGMEQDRYAYRLLLEAEEAALPNKGALTVHALENHDQARLFSRKPAPELPLSLMAFTFFCRGPGFLYAGEETGAERQPSLFDKDDVSWDNAYILTAADMSLRLCELKHRLGGKVLSTSFPEYGGKGIVAVNALEDGGKEYGFFSLSGKAEEIPDAIPEGEYFDEISGNCMVIRKGARFYGPLWLTERSK